MRALAKHKLSASNTARMGMEEPYHDAVIEITRRRIFEWAELQW